MLVHSELEVPEVQEDAQPAIVHVASRKIEFRGAVSPPGALIPSSFYPKGLWAYCSGALMDELYSD